MLNIFDSFLRAGMYNETKTILQERCGIIFVSSSF